MVVTIFTVIAYSAIIWQQSSFIVTPEREYFPSVLVDDVTTEVSSIQSKISFKNHSFIQFPST